MLLHEGIVCSLEFGPVALHFLGAGVSALQRQLLLEQVAQFNHVAQAGEAGFPHAHPGRDLALVVVDFPLVEIAIGGLAVLHDLDGIPVVIHDH